MNKSADIFQRKPLDEIISLPEKIIDVYVVEKHIWDDELAKDSKKKRIANQNTLNEFLISPQRAFLFDIFRLISSPYQPERVNQPIGQGYWIQADFGSGKSHLLSFIGALALGNSNDWKIIQKKEEESGKGKRDSLYYFYENGLEQKQKESKGFLVAVKTLVGVGSGGLGLNSADKTLYEHILDTVGDQFYLENQRTLPLYPAHLLAKRFLEQDLELFRQPLENFLCDPKFFDEEQRLSIDVFLDKLQNNQDPAIQKDCGQRLWDFYTRYLRMKPDIPIETEEILELMMNNLLEEGYAGLVLILDEISLFWNGRPENLKTEVEDTLIVLSNRLAKVKNLPIWTICAAQQAIESKRAGTNIIADDRLKVSPLFKGKDDFYDVALKRVRTITQPSYIDQYYQDYRAAFSWPVKDGEDNFKHYFPLYKTSMEVLHAISSHLTFTRSTIHFMLETLRHQCKQHSTDLVSLWSMFDELVSYEEDPSGTTQSIASIKTRFPKEWSAFEISKRHIDSSTNPKIKAYRSRCEKIVKTLFLFHIANLEPHGLTFEQIMNTVMEWQDHDDDQQKDLKDNLDHYEMLLEEISREIVQINKKGKNRYSFNPEQGAINPKELFESLRKEAEQNELQLNEAWHQLLGLNGWQVDTPTMRLELAPGHTSIFSSIAPDSQDDSVINWHGREIKGRVFMRDLRRNVHATAPLPNINSHATDLDFHVFISSTACQPDLEKIKIINNDGRVIFWSPDHLTDSERSQLAELAAYRQMAANYGGKENQDAKIVMAWLQNEVPGKIGTLLRMMVERYGRGLISAREHTSLTFETQGDLKSILQPVVGQVLDSVYISREMDFSQFSNAPFNDTNAINVINGIIRTGKIERGARPTKETDAAKNYGFALRVLRNHNDHDLDLRDCQYTQNINSWLEDKSGDFTTSVSSASIYKNFMGISGPQGIHYGLSKRMVQLYLLCLVQSGKLRITLSGKNLPVEAVDYTNIATIDFRTAILDAFDQVWRLKPPEGWDTLRPFVAILLKDEKIKTTQDDADIQSAIQQLLEGWLTRQENANILRNEIATLMAEIEQENSFQPALEKWGDFCNIHLDTGNLITQLRQAIETTYGYPIFSTEQVKPEDVDDFASRLDTIDKLSAFAQERNSLRAAFRYISITIPDKKTLTGIRKLQNKVKQGFAKLSQIALDPLKLSTELLNPFKDLKDAYSAAYLQAFDQVVTSAESARQSLTRLEESAEMCIMRSLATLPQLGINPLAPLSSALTGARDSLFPAHLTRSKLESDLREMPQPPGVEFGLDNAEEWITSAKQVVDEFDTMLSQTLLEKARFLSSPALKELLIKGKTHSFIDGLLKTTSANKAAEFLKKELGDVKPEQASEKTGLLQKFLVKVLIRRIKPDDFKPSKNSFEKDDIDLLANEFKQFVTDSFIGAEGEKIIIEWIE